MTFVFCSCIIKLGKKQALWITLTVIASNPPAGGERSNLTDDKYKIKWKVLLNINIREIASSPRVLGAPRNDNKKYMGNNLTKRQRQILDFITEFTRDKKYAPSLREIGQHFNLSSPATIHAHVQSLKQKGLLKTSFNEARSIEIVPAKVHPVKSANGGAKRFNGVNWTASLELPLVGLITAGEPIEAVEENDTIAVPADFVTDSANSYVLRVKGESMIEDGILDGDYVIVERNPSPQNGDVVVALLNNAYATLKKFYREQKRIRLQPANSKMKPIYAADPLIQGVVRGVIRKFA